MGFSPQPRPTTPAVVYSNPGGPGSPGGLTQLQPPPPIMLPQLMGIPAALPNAAGFDPAYGPSGAPPSAMPYLASMQRQNVLGPLMQPNYGLGVVAPFPDARFQYPGAPQQGVPASNFQQPMSGVPAFADPKYAGLGRVGFGNQRLGNVKSGYGSMG